MFENKLAQAYEAFTQFCVDHHLASLPLHAHQVVGAFFAYEAIFLVVSPTLSRIFFPSTYNQLRKRTKVNWDVRVVSFIQSTFICTRAIKIILKRQSDASTYDTRLWAYSNASGNVQAYAAGYFLWDLLVSAQYLGALGPGSLTHACAALLITTLGFRPFANFYGINFVLYELSNPFLNIHWFLDKFGMTGSWLQLINGLVLIGTFFCCRLVWGAYQTINLIGDAWAAWGDHGGKSGKCLDPFLEVKANEGRIAVVLSRTREFCYDEFPVPLLLLYLVSNTILSCLMVYWFGLMLKALRKRFETKKTGKKE